ncbi:hypothetical protein AB4059_06755 [Lysobacter sp. 2RAF19]
MKSPITFLNVDRLQSKVDVAARFHRLGLVLFVLACVCVTLPKGMGLPSWVPLAGFSATLLGFIIKGAGTLYEIRLADSLAKVMGLPYRRGFHGKGVDQTAWSAIRKYVIVSVALTVAAALTPSMLAANGETALANFTVAMSMAALAIQSFDNPRRMRNRVMAICHGRVDPHAAEGGTFVA